MIRSLWWVGVVGLWLAAGCSSSREGEGTGAVGVGKPVIPTPQPDDGVPKFCDLEADLDKPCWVFCQTGMQLADAYDDNGQVIAGQTACVLYNPDNPIVVGGTALPHSSVIGYNRGAPRCSGSGKECPRTQTISSVVIHSTEVDLRESGRTLWNDGGKGVHFMVDSGNGIGARVYQFMDPDESEPYHCGNSVYNGTAIAIEHVGCGLSGGCGNRGWKPIGSTKKGNVSLPGFEEVPRFGDINVAKPSLGVTVVGSADEAKNTFATFTGGQYRASATLVNELTKVYSIRVDRTHILGHDQVPDGVSIAAGAEPCQDSPSRCEDVMWMTDHSRGNVYGGRGHNADPGPMWNWCLYMSMLRTGAPTYVGKCKANDECSEFDSWKCVDNYKRDIHDASGGVDHTEEGAWAALRCFASDQLEDRYEQNVGILKRHVTRKLARVKSCWGEPGIDEAKSENTVDNSGNRLPRVDRCFSRPSGNDECRVSTTFPAEGP